MTTIPAENYEISIYEGRWMLIPVGDQISTRPDFQVLRGSGVMEYTPGFGQAHKLPGTVLSIEYVRAVVIGYDEKSRRWRLGFHIGRTGADESRWLELVYWPSGDNMLYAAAAQQAGRELAEHVGCPLKIFGVKKSARQPLSDPAQSGVTGPLVPHKREDIGPQQVRLLAQSVNLPIQYPNMWLGQDRSGLTLRLAKEITSNKRGAVAPPFNQCVIDPPHGTIRLMPPTGLLGAFLGGAQGRVIKIADVRNVELRQTTARRFETRPDDKGMATEITLITHVWDIYLTLPDESLLLAQTSHQTSSELQRHRAMAGNKFQVNSEAEMIYLRLHQADQRVHDRAKHWAESAALVIAGTIGVRLVKTQLDEEAG
jgi:hypothetical protein